MIGPALLFFFSCLLASTREGATCLAAGAGPPGPAGLAGMPIAAGGHGGVDIFLDGRWTALGGRRNVFALCFHGERLIEAGGRAGEGGQVQCWDWKAAKLLWSALEHEDLAYSVAAAGGKVFTGGGDRAIAVRALEDGRRLGYLAGHAGAVLALAASPDGKRLASAGTDRSIRLWDPGPLDLLRAIHNHGDIVHALAWSPDGKHLASGSSDRTVRLWQPEIGRLVRIIRGHDSAVLALAFGEKHIASGTADGKVRLIDAGSDAILQVLDGHRDWIAGVALTKDGVVSADWTGRVLGWKDGASKEMR